MKGRLSNHYRVPLARRTSAHRLVDSDQMNVKQKDPEQVLSGSILLHQTSIPSFHGLSHRSPGRPFAVLIVHMLQHGLGGLRASATQTFIEFVDAHRVRTLLAVEDHATLIFGRPVDRVHSGSITAASPAQYDCHHIPVTLVT
jgi:hypothetical protein